MSKKKNSKKDDDIELGSLFITIGKGFSNLFTFIGRIFLGLYHSLIIVLLFIKKHSVKLLIALVVGSLIGTFLEVKKDTTYASDLQVQPNFKSVRQLYNNVKYYNDLVKQKDTALLAKTFEISKAEAASLKKFEIYPIKNANNIISSYNDLILLLDSLTVKSYPYSEFKYTFTEFDYKVQNIHVIATKNYVFPKLGKTIISSIVENDYFKKIKNLTNQNLNRTDSLLLKNLTQIDSLRNVYMQVMLEEAKKTSTGTNIDLGGTKKTTKEIELFETSRRINNDLKDINEAKSEKSEVLNVISNFQPIGYKIKGLESNYIFLLAGLAVLLVVLFILLKELNAFLDNYKK